MPRKKKPKKDALLNEQLFDAVPKLLREDKYFDHSLDDAIKSVEAKQRVEWHCLHCLQFLRDDGAEEDIEFPLRLRIGGKPSSPEGWQVTLIAGNRRVDGFDFEARFCDMDGVERHGWHRHIWNPKVRAAEGKIAVTLFDRRGITIRDFLAQALKHMRIFYREDDGYGHFPF